ncbi:flavoprotein [Lentisphaerota bacterium WC36G]|nr:hypothetical protein LJT99_00230 [Lentisphaerae bacterium WC36]
MTKKKCIVIGVTGSIAAYKAAEICSLLKKNDCNVHVIMTESALKLITPQTFFTISQNKVTTSLWNVETWEPEHITLAERADALVIAPATANIIGKLAHGIADDALSTFALTMHGKEIYIAPAMNPRMWENPIVQNNLNTLIQYGYKVINPAKGVVACGDFGTGKLANPQDIVSKILNT